MCVCHAVCVCLCVHTQHEKQNASLPEQRTLILLGWKCLAVKQRQTVHDLTEEVAQLEHDNLDLRETIDEIMATSSELVTFHGGKYTDSIRACCYELISLSVYGMYTHVYVDTIHPQTKKATFVINNKCSFFSQVELTGPLA